jgi:hypothetical protein
MASKSTCTRRDGGASLVADALEEVMESFGWPPGPHPAGTVPTALAKEAEAHWQAQDDARSWPSPRPERPEDLSSPAYPAPGNPVIPVIMATAAAELRSGSEEKAALLWLVASAWMEGHVEGFDRAMAEAATSSSK